MALADFAPVVNDLTAPAGALTPPDAGAPGSVYEEYLKASTAAPVHPAFVPQDGNQFDTYDPDPTGANTAAEGRRLGNGWDSLYVKELVVGGKLMSREELDKTETGQKLVLNAMRARTGAKRDFVDAITDFQWSDAPFLGLFASVGKSLFDAKEVSDTIGKLQRGEDVTDEERMKFGLYVTENRERSSGTWGATVGDIVRAAPGFMGEFYLSNAALGLGRRALAKSLAKESSVAALNHVGLARATKILADETMADAMGAATRRVSEEIVKDTTKAGLVKATEHIAGDAALKKGVVSKVADQIEKSILSKELATVTGAAEWSPGVVRKVAEARAEQAFAGYVRMNTASSAVSRSLIGTGRVLADSISRGLLDVGSYGTEASSVLFTEHSSAGRALADAIGTFFVEAPLKGAELYLLNRAVTSPIDGVSRQELALRAAALQNNDPDLMAKAESIGLGLDLLEYISENTGRGLSSLGRAFSLKFLPKLAKPASRVAGGTRLATATLRREGDKVVGLELEGLIEQANGAEIGGLIDRFTKKVMGSSADVRANTLQDKVTAVVEELKSRNINVGGTAALAATIREGRPQLGLSREIADAIGPDVEKFTRDALRKAYDRKIEGLKFASFRRFVMADYMARHQLGPESAAKIFEQMGYDGVLGEMFEERYSDVMAALWGLNANKDQSLKARLAEAWDGAFPGWSQLTAEAVGFSFPMVTRAGVMRALRTIGGGSAYTEFRDSSALFLDSTRFGAVGQWTQGDLRSGYDRAIKYEQDRLDEAVAARAKTVASRPKGADAVWDRENLSELDETIAKTSRAVKRMTEYRDRFFESIPAGLRDNPLALVSHAPLSAETAELPDEEYNRRVQATEAHASQTMSASRILVSRAAKMGQTLYRMENRAQDEDSKAFRRAAHWAVKVAGALVTGDAGILSANPAQWTGVDRGLPEPVQLSLKQSYARIYQEELAKDQHARSRAAAYTDGPAGHTYQADIEKAHARALVRFEPVAQRLMAATLAAHQARMFSEEEIRDAAIEEVARTNGLAFDTATREFVDDAGKRVSMDEFTVAHRAEVDSLKGAASARLFDMLASGSLQNGRVMFSRTRDDANPKADVLAVPKDLPTCQHAVTAMLMRRLPGMRGVLRSHEINPDLSIDDQIGGPATRREWLDAVYRAVVGNAPVTAESVEIAKANAMNMDPVVAEAIARDLNFQYDGTEKGLVERNAKIAELAVLSRAMTDDNVRTYSMDGAFDRDDPAASEWTDFTSVYRSAGGMWAYKDAHGVTRYAADDAIDGKMAEMGWARTSPRVVFTSAQFLQSSDALTMIRALGLARTYRDMMKAVETDDKGFIDPLFRTGSDGYNDPDRADAIRDAEKALAELYIGNHNQTQPQLYLAPGESAQDPEAMTRAEARAKRAQDAFYHLYDEKRGYLKLADDLLRRRGVSVPFAGGLSVGSLNADFLGKYMISMNVFRSRNASGNIYVSIDHEIAQDYRTALLNAMLVDGYAKGRRILGDLYNSGVEQFVKDVDRIAANAETRVGKGPLADNLADFRAAVTNSATGIGRRLSPGSFAALVKAFVLYYTETKGEPKSVLGRYAPAFLEIAEEVRTLPSFTLFNAIVDRMYGGSGFNPVLVKAQGGTDATRGLARLYGLFAPEGMPRTLSKAVDEKRPGGMDSAAFANAVHDKDVAAMRAGLERERKARSKARHSKRPAETPAEISPTSDIAPIQEAVAGTGASESDIMTLLSTAVETSEPVPGPETMTEEKVKEIAADRVAELSGRETELHAAIEAGDAGPEVREELQDVQADIELLRHVTESAPISDDSGSPEVLLGEDDAEELEDDWWFSAGDGAMPVEDTRSETGADGEQKSFVVKDRTDLTQAEMRSIVSVAASMFNAINGMDADATVDSKGISEFGDFFDRIAPGIGVEEKREFSRIYAEMDAERRKEEFANIWTWDTDDAEEGTLPDGYEDGNRKAVAALQNKALTNFLAFAQIVNPHTGREFQGFMDDLRNTVARSLIAGTAADEALGFVNRLINPRANTAASPAIRDAYFARDLDVFTKSGNENRIAGYVRDLLGPKGGVAVNRKAALFLAYVAAMPRNVRRQMTQLISSSAPSSPINVNTHFHNGGEDVYGSKVSDAVDFTVTPRKGAANRLTLTTASAAFRPLVGRKAAVVRDLASRIRNRAIEMTNAGAFAESVPFVGRTSSRFLSLAGLFGEFFGQDSTLASVFSSVPTAALANDRYQETLHTTVTSNPGAGMPYAVQYVVNGLELLADLAGDGAVTDEQADRIAVIAFTAGNPKDGDLRLSYRSPVSSRKTSPMSTIFRCYEEVMPATIMRADVDPERSSQPASSVAITMRGVEPAVQIFMDRKDDNGFRKVCERFFPAFAKLDEANKQRILGICRQNMCWPTMRRNGIVAKKLTKTASALETYRGCETTFEICRGLANGTDRSELVGKYGPSAVSNAELSYRDGTFYVPVYSGDHSSAILLSVPLLWSFKDVTFENAAEQVSSWVGLDLLGTDAKRSATTSLEAPGVGFIGLKTDDRGEVLTDDAGNPQTGECRINIVWSRGGDNESMLGTTLATGYGVEQLKLCAKDPRSSTLKFHAMNTSNTGKYGAHLSLIKSLNVGMAQENRQNDEGGDRDLGEFGEWSANRVLMDFIRKQRSADFRDSTSIITDFDSVKLSLANSKMMGVKDSNGDLGSLMEWVFGQVDRMLAEGRTLADSYEGDQLDQLLSEFDWIDNAIPSRSGRKLLSQVLDGARLERIDGLSGPAFSLSYVDNDLMGFQVANVSHQSNTRGDRGGVSHFGNTPRNYMIDAFTMASVQSAGWNGDAGVPGVFTGVKENAGRVQDLVAMWGDLATWIANRPETVAALMRNSDDVKEMLARGEPADGRFVKDATARAVATYLRKSLLNIPIKGIDAPLVSNMSWVGADGSAKSHSTSRMFLDTLQGSRTIPASRRKFLRGHRRMALCNMNCTDPSFRYGWYLDETKFMTEFAKELGIEGAGTDALIEGVDAVFTKLRDLEESLAGDEAKLLSRTEEEQAADPEASVDWEKARRLRRRIASCFKDHHGQYISELRRTYSVKGVPMSGERIDFSIDDLFTNLVKDASGKPAFDRTAIYESMHDEKGGTHLYLGGTMVGLPRTPSYNGSMWLQTVRAALPVTEAGEGLEWKAGYDAMVAPDPFTLKILGCDHDGDKTKLYMLDAPSLSGIRAAKARIARSARFLDVNADFGTLVERRKNVTRMEDGKRYGTLEEWQLTDDAKARANNSFVQSLFDMSRALPVMDNGETSSPFYTGEFVGEGRNHGAVARGTKAALTATLKSLLKQGVDEAVAASVAWDSRVVKSDPSKKIIGGKLLDAKTGRTVGKPLVSARVGDGAQNAAEARAIVVSLASSLHIAWASGLFRGTLFHSTGTQGVEDARNWLDFMYHLDGFSNMTFDDIKEQVCSRLGVSAGMMDTIVTDMVNSRFDPAVGHLPRTDREFIDAFVKYARSVNGGGSRHFMSRSVDKTDYEMQTLVRTVFNGNRGAVGEGQVKAFLGVTYDLNAKRWVRANASAPGARLVTELLRCSQEFGRLTGIGDKGAEKAVSSLIGSIVRDCAREHTDTAGYMVYAMSTRRPVDKVAMEMLQWNYTKSALQEAKRFAKSVNYLTVDPVAFNAETESGNRADGFDALFGPTADEARVDTIDARMADRLRRMHKAVMAGYAATSGMTFQGYAILAADKFLRNTMALGSNRDIPTLTAMKLYSAPKVRRSDRMALEANAQMVGLALAAFRAVRTLPGSRITAGNAYSVLGSIASSVGGGNPGVDLKRGIEAMFEVMYVLANTSTARHTLPLYNYFSERERGDLGDYYENPDAPAAHTLSLMFQGVTESQIRDVRGFYDRVVEGRELDSAKHVGVRSGKETGLGFSLNAETFAKLRELSETKDKSGRSMMNAISKATLATAEKALAGIEAVLGKGAEVTPSAMFGQILPLYAALNSRLDRVPDSRSRSLVAVMPGVYRAWAAELAKLDGNVTANQLIKAATAVNFAPRMFGAEKDGKNGARPSRLTAAEFRDLLRASAPDFETRDASEIVETLPDDVLKQLAPVGAVQGDPRGQHTIDPLGNSGLFGDLLDSLSSIMAKESKPAEPGVPVEDATVSVTGEGVSTEPRNGYVAELAERMRQLVSGWTGAEVEYTGGNSFTLKARLGGTAALRKNPNGVETMIRFNVVDRVVPDSERLDVVNSASWQLSNANRRSDVEGREITAAQVKAEIDAMTDEQKLEYFEKWRPVGVTTSRTGDWAVGARELGVLCREIDLEQQTKHPNVVYHECFHAVVGMLKELGTFSEADVKVLARKYTGGPKGWFNEEKAAEDFRRFVEKGVVRDGSVKNIFQRILDAVRALLRMLTETGFSSEDYGRDMAESPLAAMVLTGTAVLSKDSRPGPVVTENGAPAVRPATAAVQEDLFPVIEDSPMPGIYEARLDAACGNYLGELTAGAQAAWAAYLEKGGDENFDDGDEEILNTNPLLFASSVHRDTMGDPASVERVIRGRLGNLEDALGFTWRIGMRISDLPIGRLREALNDVDVMNAIIGLTREGLLLHQFGIHPVEWSDDVFTGFAAFVTDVEAFMAQAKKLEAAYIAGGVPEAEARALTKSMTRKSGDKLVRLYDDSFGYALGSRFRTALKWFLAENSTPSPQEDACYFSAGPTVEERMEDEVSRVVPDRMKAAYSGSDTIARAIGMAIRNNMARSGLDAEAASVLTSIGRIHANTARGYERAAAIDAVRQVSAQFGVDVAKLKGAELENLVFRALVELNSTIAGGDRAQGPIRTKASVDPRTGERIGPSGSVETKEPFHVTSSQLTGAILAACGTTPEAIGHSVKRDIAAMREGYAGTSFEQVLDLFDGAMDELCAMDPSLLCENPQYREDHLGALLHRIEAGLTGGTIRADGTRENYRLADSGTSLNQSFESNRAIYGNHVDADGGGNPDFQAIAHRTIDALYTVLAGMKFYRQLGFEPGSYELDEGVPAPFTADETAAQLGIEAKQLIDGRADALDYFDQPYFVANNIESYLESTVRRTFGKVDIGEFMRNMHNRQAGFVRRCVNEENWNASLMGLDVLPGQSLTAVEEVQGKFQMEAGEIHRKDGGTYYRFQRYGAKGIHNRVSARDAGGNVVSLTEDEARMNDLVLKADKVFASGGRKVVTGVDRISFTTADSTDPSHYSDAAVKARFESGREFSQFDRALIRLGMQMPGFVANGLRERFVETACNALRKAKSMDRTRNSTTATNDFVLSELEKAGLVVAHQTLVNGEKMYDHAAMVLDVDEIEQMFEGSTARKKLIAAGRKPEWLTREARVAPLMKLYREVAAFAGQNAWLTDGDGAFFNNFKTPLPFFRGSGVFMYNANRRERMSERVKDERMAEEERTFVVMMQAMDRAVSLKRASEASIEQTRLVMALFGTTEQDPDVFRKAVADGRYEAGTDRSRRTGLVLRRDASVQDLTTVIYDRLVEALWRRKGDPVAERIGRPALERMVSAFEARKEADDAVSGGVGVTDEMMYRMQGVLPANAQLGHAVHNAIEGITNALSFRSTLVNMLMTPDADGHPVCYADPNLVDTEAGGLTDAIWEQIARWWAQQNGVKYDESKSGMENAHDVYSKVHGEFASRKTINGKKFGELKAEEMDVKSITGLLAQSDDRDAKLNRLGGGYALGYARHLLQASRHLGSGAQRAVIHRTLSYSKSLSVSFSWFFPLATKFESPIGAIGAMAMLGSNFSPDWLRKHADAARFVQKLFSGKEGWITKDFLGYKDIIQMMDSNDPFLSELVGWASALGISLSDSRINPIEPQRAIIQKDINDLVRMVHDKMGAKAAARTDAILRTMLTKSGDKAFTYALNATKLATVAQICVKLRHEAEVKGKAFDPIRDLKRYSGYINAEIGGIDPLKYAWAHPMNRSFMSMLMFSWEWTRGAWEAGGGGMIEDLVFGGHTLTPEERKYIVGRWCRMFGAVMIGVPMLFQFVIKGLALALGHDDDDDKWWTFQNEDKTEWTAFDLTPLLRAMTEQFPELAQWKKDHPVLGAALPLYTGDDRGNRRHGSLDPVTGKTTGRRYYMHFGKQGWEFARWFTDSTGQFFSKLSMPTQRILEGILGRSPSWLDRELPWDDMGHVERWLTPSVDSATANLVKAFLPFTLSGLTDMGDVGILSAAGPVQMGASDAKIKDEMAKALKAYAYNDRSGYAAATAPSGTRAKKNKFAYDVLNRVPELNHLASIARRNGASDEAALKLVSNALQGMTGTLYGELLDTLPEKPDGDFDSRRVSKICRAMSRIARDRKTIIKALENRVNNRNQQLSPELKASWDDIIRRGMQNGYEPVKRRDY